LLALASLTEPLVNLATHVIGSLGLAGVALLTLTSGVIGLPGTEPVMLFAGFNVFTGDQTLAGVIVAGVIGDVAGATIAYSIGYFGSHELLERHGGKLHLSKARLDRAHRWFDRYGTWTVFFSRFIPLFRAVFMYAAGVAAMPFKRFFAMATAGSILWISGLAVLGKEVGHNWQSWRHHLEYVDYVAAALIVALIVYVVVRRLRGGGGGPAVDVASE
jgi:membrane protein DedA with SNARE-associated domain